ncbi:MAG: hypothetical protein EB127_02020 [Alphaproteobacteria bacterium]|nr:hypothetical protein [Alphaproteobacteria bacterium]
MNTAKEELKKIESAIEAEVKKVVLDVRVPEVTGKSWSCGCFGWDWTFSVQKSGQNPPLVLSKSEEPVSTESK